MKEADNDHALILSYLRYLRPKENFALAPATKAGHTVGCKVNNMRMY
jgi:hypothetical protein